MSMPDGALYTVVKGISNEVYSIMLVTPTGPKIVLPDLDKRALYFIMEACAKWIDEADGGYQETSKQESE